jgi:hypothetical protein
MYLFMLFYVFLCCSMYFCVVLYIVCFVSFSALFVCIRVLNYCHRVATQLQLNISYRLKYVSLNRLFIQARNTVSAGEEKSMRNVD